MDIWVPPWKPRLLFSEEQRYMDLNHKADCMGNGDTVQIAVGMALSHMFPVPSAPERFVYRYICRYLNACLAPATPLDVASGYAISTMLGNTGSVSLAEWARSRFKDEYALSFSCIATVAAECATAKNDPDVDCDHIKLIKWCLDHDKDAVLKTDVLDIACKRGNRALVRWACSQLFTWFPQGYVRTATNGHVHLLRYLFHDLQLPWNGFVSELKGCQVITTDILMMEFVHKIVDASIDGGHIDSLAWILTEPFSERSELVDQIVKMSILKWIVWAVASAHENILEWLLGRDCGVTLSPVLLIRTAFPHCIWRARQRYKAARKQGRSHVAVFSILLKRLTPEELTSEELQKDVVTFNLFATRYLDTGLSEMLHQWFGERLSLIRIDLYPPLLKGEVVQEYIAGRANYLPGAWHPGMCERVIRYKNMSFFRWLVLDPKGPRYWQWTLYALLADQGLFDTIQLVHKTLQYPLNPDTPVWSDDFNHICAQAVKAENIPFIKWARENGCPWNARTADKASLRMLIWLKKHGCPWDSNTLFAFASDEKRFEAFVWAITHGCPANAPHVKVTGEHDVKWLLQDDRVTPRVKRWLLRYTNVIDKVKHLTL